MCVVIITQGGGVAAPVGGQVLSEILPYLELKKDKEEEGEEKVPVSVPNITNMNAKEAESILSEIGLGMQISAEEELEVNDKNKLIIKEQLPKPGITLNTGSQVIVKVMVNENNEKSKEEEKTE